MTPVKGNGMAFGETTSLMTTEEMLALPEDGVERWLFMGQLRERPVTVRNRWHGQILAAMSFFLIGGTNNSRSRGLRVMW
jgi:hypothetical protein